MANPQQIPTPDEDPQIGSEAYREEAQLNEARRSERRRDVVNNGYVLLAQFFPWVVILLGAVVLWHYFGHVPWRWIPPEEMEKIENFASGGFVAAVFLFLRRYIPNP